MDITAKSRQRQLKSSTALPLQSTAPFNKSTSAIHLHQTADKSADKQFPTRHATKTRFASPTNVHGRSLSWGGTFLRRDIETEDRVAVVRQMEVAERNHVHAKQKIEILKFTIADLQSLDDNVVREPAIPVTMPISEMTARTIPGNSVCMALI